jgi:hypothetical protein
MKGKKMKTLLARILTTITLSILLAAPVAAQGTQDNGALKLQAITMFYRLSPGGPLQPAVGNYYISRNATSIVFRVVLRNNAIRTIRYRLQVRQQCFLPSETDFLVSSEQEFFAATTNAAGNEITSASNTFDLEITVHPPEGNVAHKPGTHCFGDPDHLGEGPHQTLIALDQGSLNGGSDMLHVVYTKGFRPVLDDTLDFMKGTKLIEFLEQQPKRNTKNPIRRPR